MAGAVYLVVPGALATRTGGFIYDRRIAAGLRARGRRVEVVELAGRYPFPNATEMQGAASALAAIPSGATVVVDGLAYGAMPESAERERGRLALIALVHHPLAEEEGLSDAQRAELRQSEMRALAAARRVIATSAFIARALGSYGVPTAMISVVTPGTDSAPLAGGSGARERSLLCPASFIPRKGHADLLHALSGIADLPWRLICAGNTGISPATAAAVRDLREWLGLTERIELRGEVDESELAQLYAGAGLVVLPSHYEGFGMVVTEAIARGLPVITTTGGALAETLPAGAGLASVPGDVPGLRENLLRALCEPGLLTALAAGARAARANLPSWDEAAGAFDAALRASVAR